MRCRSWQNVSERGTSHGAEAQTSSCFAPWLWALRGRKSAQQEEFRWLKLCVGISECRWVSLGMLMAEALLALTGALSLLTWAAAQEPGVVHVAFMQSWPLGCRSRAAKGLGSSPPLLPPSPPLRWQQHHQLQHRVWFKDGLESAALSYCTACITCSQIIWLCVGEPSACGSTQGRWQVCEETWESCLWTLHGQGHEEEQLCIRYSPRQALCSPKFGSWSLEPRIMVRCTEASIMFYWWWTCNTSEVNHVLLFGSQGGWCPSWRVPAAAERLHCQLGSSR